MGWNVERIRQLVLQQHIWLRIIALDLCITD